MFGHGALGQYALGEAPAVTLVAGGYFTKFDDLAGPRNAVHLVKVDFQSFEFLPPAPAVIVRGQFDQWLQPLKPRTAVADIGGFVQAPIQPLILEWFDQWTSNPHIARTGADFTGFVAPQGFVPYVFDQWAQAVRRSRPGDDFSSFVAFPFFQPYVFSQWEHIPRRQRSLAFKTGVDFWDWTPPAPFVAPLDIDAVRWVRYKKRAKPLPPVIFPPKKRKPEPEQPEPFQEPRFQPPSLLPLPPAQIPPHIFAAPMPIMQGAVTSPPPFRMATPQEIDQDDEDIINLMLGEL